MRVAASAQGNWFPSTPLWQVKDLAGGGGALAPALNPPEAQRELITVYVCTVISHEPLCLWRSQAGG